jgi:hypothetical protein
MASPVGRACGRRGRDPPTPGRQRAPSPGHWTMPSPPARGRRRERAASRLSRRRDTRRSWRSRHAPRDAGAPTRRAARDRATHTLEQLHARRADAITPTGRARSRPSTASSPTPPSTQPSTSPPTTRTLSLASTQARRSRVSGTSEPTRGSTIRTPTTTAAKACARGQRSTGTGLRRIPGARPHARTCARLQAMVAAAMTPVRRRYGQED